MSSSAFFWKSSFSSGNVVLAAFAYSARTLRRTASFLSSVMCLTSLFHAFYVVVRWSVQGGDRFTWAPGGGRFTRPHPQTAWRAASSVGSTRRSASASLYPCTTGSNASCVPPHVTEARHLQPDLPAISASLRAPWYHTQS